MDIFSALRSNCAVAFLAPSGTLGQEPHARPEQAVASDGTQDRAAALLAAGPLLADTARALWRDGQVAAAGLGADGERDGHGVGQRGNAQ